MTERAMRARNSALKKWLRPWMKIKVRNRHFIEKDYLDQLKDVLKDGLDKRRLGRMSWKIDKMFAKK
jgi:ethanolamine ammonia-lyase large subunit